MSTDDTTLSLAAAAIILGIDAGRMSAWLALGRFESAQLVDGAYRVDAVEVRTWLEASIAAQVANAQPAPTVFRVAGPVSLEDLELS